MHQKIVMKYIVIVTISEQVPVHLLAETVKQLASFYSARTERLPDDLKHRYKQHSPGEDEINVGRIQLDCQYRSLLVCATKVRSHNWCRAHMASCMHAHQPVWRKPCAICSVLTTSFVS